MKNKYEKALDLLDTQILQPTILDGGTESLELIAPIYKNLKELVDRESMIKPYETLLTKPLRECTREELQLEDKNLLNYYRHVEQYAGLDHPEWKNACAWGDKVDEALSYNWQDVNKFRVELKDSLTPIKTLMLGFENSIRNNYNKKEIKEKFDELNIEMSKVIISLMNGEPK